MSAPRIALFVEGGADDSLARRGLPSLERIWRQLLRDALGLREVAIVQPIAKTHLLAMDPDNPPTSGRAEPLDVLMRRTLDREPFDVAVVAWDLFPPWWPSEACRWNETLKLYEGIANSNLDHGGLPEMWTESARRRHDELRGRSRPGERPGLPTIAAGAVLALCMDPMFEGLLVHSEPAVRRALGVRNQQIKGWPRRGWADPKVRQPDKSILTPAVNALRRHRPKLDITKHIRGDLVTHKNEWGEFLLRRLLDDPAGAASIREHPLARRLADILRP